MKTENKTISNWNEPEVLTTGRFVEIKDDYETYIAGLPDSMDLDDAISAFSSTYDLNGEIGNVQCMARLYVYGVDSESKQFEIEAQ